MKKALLTACLASLLAMAGCGKNEAPQVGTDAPASASAPTPQAAGDAVLAVIEADAYVLKIHRAIPFLPKTDPLGMHKLPEGYRYVVLDLEIQNKSPEPLEMGSILLAAKVTDETGKALDGHMPALLAYNVEHPDPRQDAAYEEVWSMEFKPGEVHRAIALGARAPVSAKSLTLVVPAKVNDDKTLLKASFPVAGN